MIERCNATPKTHVLLRAALLLGCVASCGNSSDALRAGSTDAEKDAMVDDKFEIQGLHDARAVHDTANLRFEDYEWGGRASWILATINPGPRSGSVTIPGGYVEAETGNVVLPSGAQGSTIKEGTWNAIVSAPAGAHPMSGSYSWYEPLTRKRVLLPEDFYSPFARGGVILFLPVPGKADIERFGFTRVIFSDWGTQVAPAFAFHNANPHLLDPGPQTASVAKLVQLVSQANPIVAVVAFRNLLSLGLAQPDWVRAQLARVSGPLGAVFGYQTIVIAGPNVSRPLVQETLQVIDTASEPTLRALVSGSFAAALFLSQDPLVLARAKAVLVKARQRLAVAGVDVDNDPQLSWMFGKMGI